MVTFNYKRIESQARCQDYVEGYKAIDGEILAFYIRNRNDISSITDKNTDEIYKKALTGNGVYLLFKEIDGKPNIYIGKSTQGISRCAQHINKTVASDARMYNSWEHTIYITSAVDNWSWDTVLDLERLFIGFFRSDSNKWVCLNTQSGNKGTSDIRDLNTKVAAIVSFISQERYGFNISDITSHKTVIDKYLEAEAKSALEIRLEAEKLAKQEFHDEILSKLSEQAKLDLEYGRRVREYTEFKNKVNGSSNYIMYGRIYSSKRDKKDQDVITPEKYSSKPSDEIPIYIFDGEHTFIDIASKSGNLLVPIIDKLMSDSEDLPINQNEALKKEWNVNKFSRLKHIIEDLIFAQATSYEAYLITCETLLKCIDRHLKDLDVDSIRDFNIIPNVKYHDNYMAYARSKEKNKAVKLEEIIKAGFGDNMKFDAVIGNPPYQDGTKSIYPEFIELALRLKPKHIAMITRNNWLTSDTLKDTRDAIINTGVTKLINYPVIGEIFADCGVSVCIFQVEQGYKGETKVIEVRNGNKASEVSIGLKTGLIVLCNGIDYSIVEKVKMNSNKSFSEYIGANEHYRINSNMTVGRGDNTYLLESRNTRNDEYNIEVLCLDGRQIYTEYVRLSDVPAKHDEIEKYKIISGRFLLKLGNNKESIITSLRGLKPNSICSASFAPLFISSSQVEAYNAYRYIKSKFFRFLVMLMIDNGRTGVSKARFELVPDQDFTNKSDIDWDKDIDNQLYEKYGLTQEEINHIESEICALD